MGRSSLLARDEALSKQFADWSEGRFVHTIAWLLARTGDGVFWIVAIVILFLLKQPIAWDLVWAFLATAVAVSLVKPIFKRRRPSGPGRALATDKYSFPSGHSARTAAIAMTLALNFSGAFWTILLWATAVGFSRVVLARHFISDVIAGLLLGFVIGIALYFINLPTFF